MMLNLSDRKWKVFAFTDVFEIRKGFYNKKPVRTANANIPFLGATDSDNGVTTFLTQSVIEKSSKTGMLPNEPIERKMFPGHAIAVTNNGSVGHAYYQPSRFTCSHDINPLYLKDHVMSELEALFLIPLIEQQGKLFQYARKWRPSRMINSKIMLPANEQGKPDFKFMADYEQELLEKKKNYYLKYVHSVLAKLEYVKIQPLSNLQWRTFRIDDLFESVTRPPARSKNKYDEGDIPFIASGASLNGSVKFCRPHENEVPDASNCITVSPVDGSSFYQSTEFLGRGGGGSSIIMLRSQRLNKYNGIFMARAINNTTSKYQYGHMATSDGIKRDRVLLPIDAQGQPDYDYMEQYVKNKMIQKYIHYLKYLNESVIGSNKL